jgi:hypothetical protein
MTLLPLLFTVLTGVQAQGRIELVRTVDTLRVGEQVQLAARVMGPAGESRNEWIAWRATSSSYVSLAADGRVRGIRPGRVTIMAAAGEAAAAFDVEVVPNTMAALLAQSRGRRPYPEPTGDPQARITAPPPGFDPFYRKYIDALGIPILASGNVTDAALVAARDIVNFMLAKQPGARAELMRQGFRMVIMSEVEQTTDVPEQSMWRVPASDDWRLTAGERARYNEPGGLGSQTAKQYWDRRARGMDDNPTTCAEENVLGKPGTRYYGENICVHEFVHSIMMYGLQFADPELFAAIEDAYRRAMDEGLWRGQYATTNAKEYFAEAAQTYFWSNIEFYDGDRRVQSPEDLKAYDPRVYALLERVFPGNHIPADIYYARNLRPARRPGATAPTQQPDGVYAQIYTNTAIAADATTWRAHWQDLLPVVHCTYETSYRLGGPPQLVPTAR